MTRKRLSLLVGVVGFSCAGASLVLLLVMGSVFADARTANIAGPGVDIFVRTPFPGEGGTVVLDVEARGGSRAGVSHIEVRRDNEPLATAEGKGVTWGYSIRSGKSRGSDTEQVRFAIPADLHAGDALPLTIVVDYVVAMSSNGRFSNDRKHDVVPLELRVYSSSGRLVAQLARVALALGCFGVWFMFVWGVVKLYTKAGDDAVGRNASAAAEGEAIGLLMGFMGGSILGYWLFAWRIMNALELRSTLWAVLLMFVWCLAPLVFVWKWNKRRKNRANLPSARVVAR